MPGGAEQYVVLEELPNGSELLEILLIYPLADSH